MVSVDVRISCYFFSFSRKDSSFLFRYRYVSLTCQFMCALAALRWVADGPTGMSKGASRSVEMCFRPMARGDSNRPLVYTRALSTF